MRSTGLSSGRPQIPMPQERTAYARCVCLQEAGMKKCTRCGALQDDKRSVCLDCGERLPSPLAGEELEKAQAELDKKISSLSDRADDFYVNRLDKAFIVLNAVGIIADAVICVLKRETVGIFLGGIVALTLFLLSALLLMFPEKAWRLKQHGLASVINEWDDVSPSLGWIWGMKITCYIMTGMGGYLLYYMAALF